MSAREWRRGVLEDSWLTGTSDVGASVEWAGSGPRWVVAAWMPGGREMDERGIATHPAAMIVAEGWLDLREAEAQQAQKGGTT